MITVPATGVFLYVCVFLVLGAGTATAEEVSAASGAQCAEMTTTRADELRLGAFKTNERHCSGQIRSSVVLRYVLNGGEYRVPFCWPVDDDGNLRSLTAYEVLLLILADNADVDELYELRQHGLSSGLTLVRDAGQRFQFETWGNNELFVLQRGRRATWVKSFLACYDRAHELLGGQMPPMLRSGYDLDALERDVASDYGSAVAQVLKRFFRAYASTIGRGKEDPDISHGLLLHGPAGTGKSRLIGIIKSRCAFDGSAVLFEGTAADLNSRYVGDTEKKLRSAMLPAKSKPRELFLFVLEEADTLAKRASSGRDGAMAGALDYKMDALMVLMDVVERFRNVIFIFSTNRRAQMDERVLRDGRVDRHVFIGPPERALRIKFFQEKAPKALETVRSDDEVAANFFADVTAGMPYAQLHRALVEASNCFNLRTMESLEKCMMLGSIDARNRETETRTFGERVLEPLLHEEFLIVDTSLANDGDASRNQAITAWPVLSADILAQVFLNMRQELHRDGALSGRLEYFVPSRLLSVERTVDGQRQDMHATLPRHDAVFVAATVWFLVNQFAADFVVWIDADFRRVHASDFEDAVNEALRNARQYRGHALIIVDADAVAGLVPSSFTRSQGSSVQQSATVGNGTSRQKSTGHSRQAGHTYSHAITSGSAVQVTVSENYAKLLSKTETNSTFESNTHGNTLGVQAGFSLSGLSFSASEQSSHSHTSGKGHSSGRGESEQRGRGFAQGVSYSGGNTEQTGVSHGEAINDVESSSDSRHKSESFSMGINSQIGVTVSVQYPRALSTVLQLFHDVDRIYRPHDPAVLLLYKVIEPGAAGDVVGTETNE